MKKGLYIIAAMLLTLDACLSDDIDTRQDAQSDSGVEHNATLILEGGRRPFDDDIQTRAAYYEGWKDGDRLFIKFKNGSSTVSGIATYSADTDTWSISYYGTIVRNAKTACTVYYFDNPESMSDTEVRLSPVSAVYEDLSATYLCLSANEVYLETTLKCKTGRVRFIDVDNYYVGTDFRIGGLSCYTRYDFNNNTFETSEVTVSASSLDELDDEDDVYLPYVYMWFTNTTSRQINVYVLDAWENASYIYGRNCGTDVLAKGHSGYVHIPTPKARNGWTRMTYVEPKTYTVKGVTFQMVWVAGGTFQMGSETGYSSETPVHAVTLDDYWIGQTEVTQELWEAVMGSNPSKFKGTNLPVEQVSWNDCQTFISNLNQLTGQTFRLPTEAEWEYAARGGSRSRGYTYSGSDDIDDVAWYYGNSGSTTHNVATKSPNELGLYDMSGNVWEWCQDWYGPYGSSAQTNPTGPVSGSHRVYRGGSWGGNAFSCRVANRNSVSPSYCNDSRGLRLAL